MKKEFNANGLSTGNDLNVNRKLIFTDIINPVIESTGTLFFYIKDNDENSFKFRNDTTGEDIFIINTLSKNLTTHSNFQLNIGNIIQYTNDPTSSTSWNSNSLTNKGYVDSSIALQYSTSGNNSIITSNENLMVDSNLSSILGGSDNIIINSDHSVITGGFGNIIDSANNTFIIGSNSSSGFNNVIILGNNIIANKTDTVFTENLEVQKGDIHITEGNFYIDSTTSGIHMKSINNGDWKIGVNNMGGLYTDDGIFKRSHTFGLYTQTITSNDVTTTTTETTILGTAGVGSLTVPSNIFQIGDSFHVKIGGELSASNFETIRLRIKSGFGILADTGIITVSAITNKFWEAEIDFIVRNNGTAGQASIVTNGQFVYNVDGQNSYEGQGFNNINNSTFDTTISNTLDITVEWGSANASNTIKSDFMILKKIF